MTTINEITMTVAGNLVADPKIKHTTTGRSVARFRIAQTAAVERNGAWEDGQTTFIRCVAYGPIADHIAASRIGKGTRLVVTGRYAQRDWQTDHRHPTPGRPISERPTPPRHGMRGGPFPYPISRHTPQDRETDVASHGIRYRPDAATHSDIE